MCTDTSGLRSQTKLVLAFICAALLVISSGSLATADAPSNNPVVDWNWGANRVLAGPSVSHSNHVDLTTLGTVNTVGAIVNRIGTGAPINNSITDPNDPPPMVGSLSFIQQLDSSSNVPNSTAPGQFRLRRNDSTLNPEIDVNYTQLYWQDSADTNLYPGLTWSLALKNNAGVATVRPAIQDTLGNWHLGATTTNTDGVFSVDLGLETWAPYTPATSTSASLQLAPGGGYGAFAGQVQAFGFFAQDTDGLTTERMRIAYFEVVPEPGTLALAGLGALGMIALRRRS